MRGWRANQKPTSDAAERADDEGEHRLLQRDPQMLPDHAADEPIDDLRGDVDRIREEERRQQDVAGHRIGGEHIPERDRRRRRPGFAVRGALSARHQRPLRLRVALDHLGLQFLPDLAVQFVERRVELDLGDVARARQRHAPVADDARGRPRRHDHDAVGERDRLFEIVGDEQHRLAVGAPQIEQQIAHDLPRLRVERAERLVHQQDLRIADQHLREPDALALAAGEHVRIAVGEGGEADALEPILRARASLAACRPSPGRSRHSQQYDVVQALT